MSDRPQAPAPNYRRIPPELRKLVHWVCWAYARDDQVRWTKVPRTPRDGAASTTDPSTWSTFDDACAGYQRAATKTLGRLDGIGFVTSADDPYVLIDLDHCLDGKTIAPWAKPIITAAKQEGAYIERSPSGTGVHIIGRGPQGDAGAKRNDAEIYSTSRFFTITGVPL